MPKKNKITSQTPKRISRKIRNTTRSENSVTVKRPRRYTKRDPNYRFPLYDDECSSSPDRELEDIRQPSTSSQYATPDFSRRKDGSWKFDKDYMKIVMNAYKDSPDWRDLKAKRFNTSFLRETPRGDRDIQIFTPEEENDPMYQWPDVGMPHLGLGVEPGSTTVTAYCKWLDFMGFKSDSGKTYMQMLNEPQKKGKEKKPRGRKPKYNDGPYTEEQLDNLTNWDKLLNISDSEENKDDEQKDTNQSQIKGAMSKKGKRKLRKSEDSDSEYEEPKKSKKQKPKQGKSGTPKKRSRLNKKMKDNDNDEVNEMNFSMELKEGDKVSGKEAHNKRKSTRNAEIKKYVEIDSDYDSDDNASVSPLNALKSKIPKVMMDKGKKKKTLFALNLLPFEKPIDNRILRVHLYKNISSYCM